MESPDLDNLLTQYNAELVEDLKLDELNLKDKTMMVPTIKHKWVGRLMTHKAQLSKLLIAKKKAIKAHTESQPVALKRKIAEQVSLSDPTITQIQENIEKLELIIDYLEKVEKLASSLTWDCKNLIDLQKLETT